ncbi:prephenate dehydrogenase [bacterium]|nr:MAG: prephenate dehydrogenase [bacterium]
MKPFKKVVIVGVGLIGGSLALVLKKNRLASSVIGIARHKDSIKLAIRRGVIDGGSLDFSIAEGADLLVFATPVGSILSLASDFKKIVPADCIVMDVGSTKEKVVNQLSKIFPNFIGTHPMAGSEKKGVMNSQVNLFKDSLCIITPVKKTNKQALHRISQLWKSLGVKVFYLKPAQHDRIISFVSHLPHLVAFSMINNVAVNFMKFASTSLRDGTRVAASDPQMWRDILLTNRGNILKAVRSFQKQLELIENAVANKDSAKLSKIIKEANKRRRALG